MTADIELHVVRPYLSIKELPDVRLPAFSIITGPNGSGKTHLLKAIGSGAVQLIRDGRILPAAPPLDLIDGDITLTTGRGPDLPREVAHARTVLAGVGTGASMAHLAAIPNDLLRFTSQTVYVNDPNQIGEHEVMAAYLESRAAAPFELNAAELVHAHMLRAYQNRQRRFFHADGASREPGLSDSEFAGRYGPDPLAVMNKALESLGLRLQLTSFTADLDAPRNVALSLTNEAGDEIATDALSSGEKTLLGIVASVYKQSHRPFPTVLLLDEVASHLHPAAGERFVRDLQTIFSAQGTVILLTTHSPTLVATSPEGTVFLMQRTPPRIRGVSRDEAIGRLTAGVPALRIEASNCRQVLVEDEVDAQILSRIYQYCRGDLEPAIALSFVSSGAGRKGAGNSNRVEQLVGALASGGSRTVRGVVDWDGLRTPGGALHVLGRDERYAIENCVVDPLLLALLLIWTDAAILTAAPTAGVRGIDLGDSVALQLLSDEVSARVIQKIGGAVFPTVNVGYRGGLSLEHPRAYLEHQGHRLLAAAIEAYPALNQYVKNQSNDNVLRAIVQHILPQFPECIPNAFVALFSELQREL